MSYKLNSRARKMLENAGADDVGDTWVSFMAVTIPLSSRACKELNEQANDDPDTLPDDRE
ncbi:hypothetical protein [Burkholderia sp. BCC1993]|uniref:hypothetical protein n=1 Tax=Burkholderia sp. BCC1993 TaxID=2817444 RepID=UPI002AB2DEA9|nr:hypothetical protein [Burkholderia sp. BCC1993]